MPGFTQHPVKKYLHMVALFCMLPISQAHAGLIGYADVVLDYFNSGTGQMSGPYGGYVTNSVHSSSGVFPVPISTGVVLGSDPSGPGAMIDFLSLSAGSYVTLGFTNETIVDSAGADFSITEAGVHLESADVFVSSNLVDFFFLGTVFSNISTAMDLATIGFTGSVQAIRVVGRDNKGGSRGYDLANIEVFSSSIGRAGFAAPIAVPEPTSLVLMILGLAALSRTRPRKSVIMGG